MNSPTAQHGELKPSMSHQEQNDMRKRPIDSKSAAHSKHHDAALDVLGGERVVMTDEQVSRLPVLS